MKLSFVDSGQLPDFKAIDKENKLTCDDYAQNQTVASRVSKGIFAPCSSQNRT